MKINLSFGVSERIYFVIQMHEMLCEKEPMFAKPDLFGFAVVIMSQQMSLLFLLPVDRNLVSLHVRHSFRHAVHKHENAV